MSSNTTDDSGEAYGINEIKTLQEEATYLNSLRMMYIVGYLIICTLGLLFNLLVIVTACSKLESWKKNITIWILALAVTHLLCSAFLPLQFLYAWYHFNWLYGAALCKVSSYVIYTSMFSTAAALSLWSVSCSVSSSKCFKDLPTRCVSHRMSKLLILSSWTFGVVLSIPSLLSRELRYTKLGQECIDDFDMIKEETTDIGRQRQNIVVLCRFMLGILVPAFVMIVSYCLARRQHRGLDKTYKRIICMIKVAYFVCWVPLLFLGVLQLQEDPTIHKLLKYLLPAATVLAAAHCCVNPVIYLLVGRNIKWIMLRNTAKCRTNLIPLKQNKSLEC